MARNHVSLARQCVVVLRAALAGAATALLVAPAALAQTDGPVANTTSGQVQGIVNDAGVLVFRGIPYAADTGGENRFLPPREREPWDGVLNAAEFGAKCPQTGNGEFFDPTAPRIVSEDCLFTNVWTSGLSGRRPVFVNFHGGAWRSGSGNMADGSSFVELADAVAVSTNNRLNVFGHLSLDDSFGPEYAHSGNNGMLDLHMALQWVRENIADFGGDPDNITILGASGGGAKTLHAMAMPMFAGMFQHAIVIGGHDLWKRNTLQSARARSAAILEKLDIEPGDIQALQNLPMDALLAAHDEVLQAFGPDPSAGPIPWTHYDLLLPVIDGETLPEFPIDAIANGASADVDLMLGTSRMEHWFTGDQRSQPWGWLTRDQLVATLSPYLGDATNEIVEAYEDTMRGASPSSLLHRITRDRYWHLPHLQLAAAKAEVGGNPAYLWFVDADVISSGAATGYGETAFTDAAAGQFTTAWTSFADDGDPNHEGIPTWQPYTSEDPAMMVFGLETYGAAPLETLSIWKNER